MEAWRAELYHHGIEGQKWGVRNGPPYPLEDNDKSDDERRAEMGQNVRNSYAGAHSGESLAYVSDADLQAYVSRLSMERTYAELTKKPDATREAVKNIAGWLKDISSIAQSVQTLKKFVAETFKSDKPKKTEQKPKDDE